MLADRRTIKGIRARFNNMKIDDATYVEPEFIVLKDLDEEMVLGAVIMQEMGIELYMREERYRIGHGAAHLVKMR